MDIVHIKAKIGAGFLSLLGRLPLGALYKVGDFVAWFFSKVMHYRKDVVFTNLSRAFPEADYDTIRQIAKDYYKHLGEIIAETIWHAGCKGRPERLRKQNLYRSTNMDLLLDLREKNGIICLRSHMGNWEVAGGIYEFNHEWDFAERMPIDDIFVAYKPLHNKVSDEVFLKCRASVIPGYKGMLKDSELLRHVIRHKDRRPVYMVIADQYPYFGRHHVGTFLNQPTEGMLGTFTLAHKLGLAVVTTRESRDGRGHYVTTYEILSEDASNDKPEELIKLYFKKLEEDIIKDPANWLWSHKRWRH